MDSVRSSAAPAARGAIIGVSVRSWISGIRWTGVRVWKERLKGIWMERICGLQDKGKTEGVPEERICPPGLCRLAFTYHEETRIMHGVKNRWSHSKPRSDHLLTSLVLRLRSIRVASLNCIMCELLTVTHSQDM